MIAALFLITRGGPVSAAPFTLRDHIILTAVLLTVTIAFELLSRTITPKNTRR